MILTGPEIERQAGLGRISLSDFDAARVTTNSYDLRLGSTLLRYADGVLDPREDNEHERLTIPDKGFVLPRGSFHLGETAERFGSDHYVPKLHAKSGIARLGLFVHVTADLIDLGAHGRATLQLYATLPVRVRPGMLIAQVTFWRPEGEIVLYQGKYQGSEGPMTARPWR